MTVLRRPVPALISPLQARRVLRAAGLLTAVEAWCDADPSGVRREEWDYAVGIPRDSALIAAAAEHLGLTPAEVDDLFRAAAAL